jgi:glycosyltransferase involved in cell wall biosynthesis
MIKMLKGQKAIALGNELIKDISPPLERKDIALLPNSLKNDVSDKEFEKIILNRRKRKSFSILFLSNMDKTKGWPKLLQACNILKKRRIKFKCSFVGAWQSKKDEIEFDNFISKNNLNNNVFYLGRKTGAEKNKVLTESDILVFPTEYKLETFGLVILEAMMYGLPVIANGIATIPSTIKDDRTGFILKENFPEEIASRIEILAKNRKLRENMGIKGRKRFLQEFELQKYSKRLISICNSS